MRSYLIVLVSAALLWSCENSSTGSEQASTNDSTPDTSVESADRYNESAFASEIGTAHGKNTWDGKKVIEGNIRVVFGGNERLNGRMMAETSVGRVRMELEDGTLLVWDGDKAWVSPDTSSFGGARFHLRTWPYFLAAPMKLNDPGTVWQDMEEAELMGQEYNRKRLTFESNVGDSPDDWYVIYKDPSSDKLKAMSYVVTYGTPLEKANEAPHIIVYNDYQEIDGTMLSTQWTFYNWSEEQGMYGDSIGYVKLENLAFTEVADSLFSKPENAREDEMPNNE